jgi:hypothetical protein
MICDKNMVSHAYNEELADEIYKRIKTYVPQLIKQLDALEKSLL